jgi:hypothetical protein
LRLLFFVVQHTVKGGFVDSKLQKKLIYRLDFEQVFINASSTLAEKQTFKPQKTLRCEHAVAPKKPSLSLHDFGAGAGVTQKGLAKVIGVFEGEYRNKRAVGHDFGQ